MRFVKALCWLLFERFSLNKNPSTSKDSTLAIGSKKATMLPKPIKLSAKGKTILKKQADILLFLLSEM